ncbi:hypothetical protein [Staphylococcus succinus]|uniref:hypothetical protein n=1 Tax=Staphylococcus succinus TaxID=61015 RepID=UPI00301B8C1B
MTNYKMDDQHEYLESYLSILYKTPGYKVCDNEFPGDLPYSSLDWLAHFNAIDVTIMTPLNEWFCGIKDNDVVIEKGYWHTQTHPMYIITGNHKGHRNIIILKGGWMNEN